MRIDKSSALKLRLIGKSYGQIRELLNIPKSTLSSWLRDTVLSDTARYKIASRARDISLKALLQHNHQQTYLAEKRSQEIRRVARQDIVSLIPKELLVIGIALYWAEGHKRPITINGKIKTHHPVSLTNSDPGLVKIYLRFLREICEVPEEKITGSIRIYKHQSEAYLLSFWSTATKIPPSRFQKTYYGVSKSSLGKRPFNILPYGTIQVRVNSTVLYHKIMGWIEGISNLS